MSMPLSGWPTTETGEPIPPALLLEATSGKEVLNARMTLTAMGIPLLVQNPNPAIFTTVLFGTEIIGGDLYVPETLLEDAKALLHDQWTAVDDEGSSLDEESGNPEELG